MNIQLAALVILIVTSIILTLFIAFKRDSRWCHWITGASLVAAFICQCYAFYQQPLTINLLSFSPINILLSQLALTIVLVIWLPLKQWLTDNTSTGGPFYLMLLWLTIGTLVMISSNHFAIFFLGLELLSLSLIGLIGYQCPEGVNHKQAMEAAIKYLILSAIGSTVILLGFALLYIDSASLSLDAISNPEQLGQGLLSPWLVAAAIIFILCGVFFKLSLVPCHMWFADLVQGSPTPVAALLSTVSKLAIFVVMFKLFITSQWFEIAIIAQVVTLVAIISMLWGNVLALKQQNIYRLLAYSSIAHFGYLTIVIAITAVSANHSALIDHEVLVMYLSAYLLALTGIFSILSQLGNCDTLAKLQGLLWRQPFTAVTLILMTLSLAGIPLTFGFVAKFYLIVSSVDNQLWYLLGALVLGSVISLFYYFNLIITLAKRSEEDQVEHIGRTSASGRVLNSLIILIVIGFGIYPEPIAQLIASL